jgi:hypothetical protein
VITPVDHQRDVVDIAPISHSVPVSAAPIPLCGFERVRLGVTEVRSAFIVAAVGLLLEGDQGPGREKVFRDQAEI